MYMIFGKKLKKLITYFDLKLKIKKWNRSVTSEMAHLSLI